MVKNVILKVKNQEANMLVSVLRRDYSETGEKEYLRLSEKIFRQLRKLDKVI